jgi:hypothetical protein
MSSSTTTDVPNNAETAAQNVDVEPGEGKFKKKIT